MTKRNLNPLLATLAIIVMPLLGACNDGAYLMQCAAGHLSLMSRARPIDEVLADDREPPEVREQLGKVVRLRDFAVSALQLPDTGSYRSYVDLQRPYAVWNLVAAPELSLELQQWCFPIAGCVTYRGYFDEQEARAAAAELAARGFDVDVYGVQAYSTLNWFDDPVLNTFLRSDDLRLAAILFHEMAHQVVYVKGDTRFNESFAKTVELEGLRRWLQESADPGLWQECQRREQRAAGFHELLAGARAELQGIYASAADDAAKRAAKAEVIDRTLAAYEGLRGSWQGYAGYDAWIKRGLNNARLAANATYHDLVPAFQALLQQSGAELPAFYLQVKTLGALPAPERLARLQALATPPSLARTSSDAQ